MKTFSDDGVDFKRFEAGLGVGVALEFGRIIARFGWTIRFGRCTEVGQSEEYELFYCCRI